MNSTPIHVTVWGENVHDRTREDVKRLVERDLARWIEARAAEGKPARVMIHAHGGLNDELTWDEPWSAGSGTYGSVGAGDPPTGRVQQNATWDMVWQLGEDASTTRLRGLESRDFREHNKYFDMNLSGIVHKPMHALCLHSQLEERS